VFTSREGGTTSAIIQPMFDKEQWLEVGAMELDNDDVESVSIVALDIEQLLPEAKEKIKEKAMLDDQYRKICKQVVKDENIDKNFALKDDILCWKNRIYVLEGL
jgi:hypothetical protein